MERHKQCNIRYINRLGKLKGAKMAKWELKSGNDFWIIMDLSNNNGTCQQK